MCRTATMDSPRLQVTVPATTSNLGPGFDALGLALTKHNRVVVTAATKTVIELTGEGAESLPRDEHNVMIVAFKRGCSSIGIEPPALHWHCTHEVPPARGLGSSAAAIVAGLTVADGLSNGALGRARVLEIATEMEGHPDNAAPAVYGGLQCAVSADGKVFRTSVSCRSFPKVALFIPTFEMKTSDARAVLPGSLTRSDAVFNISRTALLVAAMAQGDFALLDEATRDRLHQGPRAALFPAMPAVFGAARSAGAHGVFLSGAGSTIAAFSSEETASHVALAMQARARELGVEGRAEVVDVDVDGAVWRRG